MVVKHIELKQVLLFLCTRQTIHSLHQTRSFQTVLRNVCGGGLSLEAFQGSLMQREVMVDKLL